MKKRSFFSLMIILPSLVFANGPTPASKICMIAQTLKSLDTSSPTPTMIRLQSTSNSTLESMIKSLGGPDAQKFIVNTVNKDSFRYADVSVTCNDKIYKFVCYGDDYQQNIQCNSRKI